MRSGNLASRRALRPVAGLASSDFSQKVHQDRIIQHALGQQPLELAVLILELAQLPGIGHFQAAVLRLQLVERCRAEAVLAANLHRRQACFLLLDHPDDLLLGKTDLPHSSAPSLGQTVHQIEEASGRQVTDDAPLRQGLRELAAERRPFGFRRLGYLLANEGTTPNHKKLLRVYRDENQRVRRRGGRKRLRRQGTNVATASTERAQVARLRVRYLDLQPTLLILYVGEENTQQCPALAGDTSLSGVRGTPELTRLIGMQGKPHTAVSDNRTELTSLAILRWS